MPYKVKQVDEITHDHSRSRRKDACALASGKKSHQEIQDNNAVFIDTESFKPSNLSQSIAAMVQFV